MSSNGGGDDAEPYAEQQPSERSDSMRVSCGTSSLRPPASSSGGDATSLSDASLFIDEGPEIFL